MEIKIHPFVSVIFLKLHVAARYKGRFLFIDINCLSESCFPRCQRLFVCVWLHLFQWRQPDGQVRVWHSLRGACQVSLGERSGIHNCCGGSSSYWILRMAFTPLKSRAHGRIRAVLKSITAELYLALQFQNIRNNCILAKLCVVS